MTTNVTVDRLVSTSMEISITENKTLDARETERRAFDLNYLLSEVAEGTDRKQKSRQDSIFSFSENNSSQILENSRN